MAKMPGRVKTGIQELDRALDGGLLQGSTTLVHGAPGVGKTTLGLQFLYEGAVQFHEPGILVTFEEFPASLYRDADELGWDLQTLERQGILRIIFTSPEIFLASMQSSKGPISDLIEPADVKRVVLDSATMFTRIARDPLRLRDIYNNLINGLKREGLTSLLTSEDRMRTPSPLEQGKLDFVVDGIILMRYVEISSSMQRAMTILKMRGVNHDRSIRRFEIRPGGIKIGEPFEGLEGILSGSSHSRAR